MIKNIYIIMIMVLFSSCSHKKQQEKLPVKKNINAEQDKKPVADSIVLIEFEKSNISIHWNNLSSQIVDDSLFKNLKHKYENERNYLVNQITNVKVTSASACAKNKLVTGDLAFLIVNKIDGLPFFEITHLQGDVFESNCPYPIGYFDAIGRDRFVITKNVKRYLLSKHKL